MNGAVAALWIAALRSGRYKQGRDQLRRGEKCCCLGVLCDLHRKETGKGVWGEAGYYVTDDSPRDNYYLPEAVQKWAGLKTRGGHLPPAVEGDYEEHAYSLANMNDSGDSFEVIANIIERDWRRL